MSPACPKVLWGRKNASGEQLMQHAMEDVKRLNVMSANMFEQAKWEQFKVKLENGCKPLPHIPDATPKAIPKHIIRAVAGREPWLLWNI